MTQHIKQWLCWLFGHRWEVQAYQKAPKGWSYEEHRCSRCDATRRELVASRLG